MSNVAISVTDTGLGILPGRILHIFDRFYQADETHYKDQEGTGIGLALTKELVELHHGEIKVESTAGKGARFTVLLPLGTAHLDGGEIDPRPVLLVVEDNSDLRNYIRDCLDESFQVVEAVNGLDGLDIAIQIIPDLVISDVMMPEMDGNELCKKLKSNECTIHIPVILLTARASVESKIEGLETGIDNTLHGNDAILGGGIYLRNSGSDIRNTIVWDNTADSWPDIYQEISMDNTVSYSDVQGGWTGAGIEN